MKIIYTLFGILFSFGFSQAQVCQVFITHMISGNQVQYYGSSPDNPTGWSWFFNGGNPLTASIQNPGPVTYSGNGVFITALSVYGGPNSCSSALSNALDSVNITSTGVPDIRAGSEIKLLHKSEAIAIEIYSGIDQKVSLHLYDLSGRRIDEIFNGMLKTGSNIFELNAIGLSDGTYMIQGSSENISFVKKFVWTN